MKKEKRKSEQKLLGCGARYSSLQKEVEQERRMGALAPGACSHFTHCRRVTYVFSYPTFRFHESVFLES